MPFPLNLIAEFGQTPAFIIYALLGFCFGFILESAGFGNSRKLAAQFYFQELTVLKVMFTAIIVAMTLIFFTSAIGILDYNLIWVNPTYLWPGILGGLIMGVGFIIGGFCPGTSLVAAATFKIDGIFFVAGALFGIFIFGDSVDTYSSFFYSSYLGRLTLPDITGSAPGVVVVLIVAMALAIFVGAEWLEKQRIVFTHWQKTAAFLLLATAAVTAVIGQPDLNKRWQVIEAVEMKRIESREIFASPLEVASLQNNRQIIVEILDVRQETDFNYFNIRDSKRIPTNNLLKLANTLIAKPANTVFVLTSNDESLALSIWKQLRAASVPNMYILEGGINGWLQQFADKTFLENAIRKNPQPEELRFSFPSALGHRYTMSAPNPKAYTNEFTNKIKLEVRRAPTGGGCG